MPELTQNQRKNEAKTCSKILVALVFRIIGMLTWHWFEDFIVMSFRWWLHKMHLGYTQESLKNLWI